jgi:hypothetical protein
MAANLNSINNSLHLIIILLGALLILEAGFKIADLFGTLLNKKKTVDLIKESDERRNEYMKSLQLNNPEGK